MGSYKIYYLRMQVQNLPLANSKFFFCFRMNVNEHDERDWSQFVLQNQVTRMLKHIQNIQTTPDNDPESQWIT